MACIASRLGIVAPQPLETNTVTLRLVHDKSRVWSWDITGQVGRSSSPKLGTRHWNRLPADVIVPAPVVVQFNAPALLLCRLGGPVVATRHGGPQSRQW
jgi:hypothetical protein